MHIRYSGNDVRCSHMWDVQVQTVYFCWWWVSSYCKPLERASVSRNTAYIVCWTNCIDYWVYMCWCCLCILFSMWLVFSQVLFQRKHLSKMCSAIGQVRTSTNAVIQWYCDVIELADRRYMCAFSRCIHWCQPQSWTVLSVCLVLDLSHFQFSTNMSLFHIFAESEQYSSTSCQCVPGPPVEKAF